MPMSDENGSADPRADREALAAALRRWNSIDTQAAEETTAQLVARIEREDREARETARAEALAAQIAKLNEKLDALTAQTAPAPPRLTRLGFSAAEKSRYIRQHGLSEYEKLPLK
jgi:hypothetical protein